MFAFDQTFFVARFSRQQERGVLIGRDARHSVGGGGEGRLRDQPRHQRHEPAPFDGPFGRAIGARHAEKKRRLVKKCTQETSATASHSLIGDGGEALIVDRPADFCTMSLCGDAEMETRMF